MPLVFAILLLTTSASSAAATGEESREGPPALEVDQLAGAWAGTMTHAGESEPFALELETGEEGRLVLRATIPAIHLARHALGAVKPRVEGDEVQLGPFTFTWDADAETLSGTMPDALVPAHEIPVTLRRVERVEVPSRPEPSAPFVEPEWVFEGDAALWPGAAFDDGVVYAGSDGGHLYALDARTGERLWSFQAGGSIRTRAAVDRGAVYFQADDGVLYRVDAATGHERWRAPIVEGSIDRVALGDPRSRYDSFGSDVVVAEGRLFVGTHDGRVLALDRGSGERIWSFATGGSVLAAPALDSGRVYAGSYDACVYALDAGTGALVWKHDTKGAVVSTPAVAGEHLVVGTRAYDVLGLEARIGRVAWTQYVWFSWIESSATVRDGVAYVGSSDAAAAFAFDARTGERLWTTDVWGWAWGQPAVTDDRVFLGTAGLRGYQADQHEGGLMSLDRETGRPVWRYASPRPEEGPWGFPGSPAVGAGLVFATGIDGRVYAFRQ
jgi:outer membrane protein assembly factor BamB